MSTAEQLIDQVVDGTHPVEVIDEQEKWIQGAIKRPGALHKAMGIPDDQDIPMEKINALIKKLEAKAKGDKKLSPDDARLMKQAVMAKNLKKMK